MPTLATFNVNNFYLRYRFANTYPGDVSKKSAVEAAKVTLGYIPERKFGKALDKDFVIWDPVRRDLAAQLLSEPDGALPDILCLQEVENMDAIRKFNEDCLGGHYKYCMLIDGYDPRNIDVALLSVFPIVNLRSNIDALGADGQRILSRDCLEATLSLKKGEEITLFINHLKSKFVDSRGISVAKVREETLNGHRRRLEQAKFVAKLVQQRFDGQHNRALYAVVGDFNDTVESPWVRPLVKSKILTDIVAQTRDPEDRWTYYWRAKGRVQQIDHVLASKALAARVKKTYIARSGLAYNKLDKTGVPLPKQVTITHLDDDGVTPIAASVPMDEKISFELDRFEPILDDVGNNTSDHCPIKVWF